MKNLLKIANKLKPFLGKEDVLSHIYFNQDKISAFDGRNGIFIDYKSKLSCGLPGNDLLKLLRTIKDKDFNVINTNDKTVFICGKTRATFTSKPLDDFIIDLNEYTKKEPNVVLELNETIIKGLEFCLHSARNDLTYPSINGVTIYLEDRTLNIYSTDDEARLSWFRYNNFTSNNLQIVLPKKFCDQLVKLYKNFCTISIFEDHVIGVTEGTTILTIIDRTIEVLDFREMIEEYYTEDMEFYKQDRKKLDEITKRSIIVNTENPKIMVVDITGGTAKFTTNGTFGNVVDTLTDIPNKNFYGEIDPSLCNKILKLFTKEVYILAENDVLMFLSSQDDYHFFQILSTYA